MNRVLIVDDAAFMRLILKRMLTGNGYNVAGEASDVVEAIRSYEKLRPDLVIMDLSMPGRGDRDSKNDYSFSHRNSGIDAIKEIIKLDPNAKILVCSALGDKEAVMEAINAGAKNYIIKPFDAKNLLLAINKLAR